jgi:hypothetical protein
MEEVASQCCHSKGLLQCDDGHVCSRHTCRVENVPVTVYKQDGKLHFCSLYCKERPHDKICQPVGVVSNVYFCLDNGKVHRCSKACLNSETEEVLHGVRMCGITGVSYGQEEVSLYQSQRTFREMRMYRDPYCKHRGVRKTLNDSSQFESALRCQAMKMVHMLIFSNRRAYAERRKKIFVDTNTKKKLASYVKGCHSVNRPIALPHLICIALHHSNRKGWKRPDDCQEFMVKKCADLAVSVWTVLCKHTVLQDCNRFTRMLPTLVASLLYLMKSGLPMNNVQIIPKNFFLEAALPEANTLNLYGVSRGQFTAIKNEIRDAIRKAIQSKRLNPRALIVHGV